MNDWLVNGARADTVAITDRGFAYGDGVFETIAIRDCAPRFLDRHLQRLAAGCRQLGFEPPGLELIESELQSLIRGAARQTAKIIVTRGSGPRGYASSAELRPTRVVGIGAAAPIARINHVKGVRVRRCQTRLGENPALAGIKHLNRLEQVLARSEWDGGEIAEGLLLSSGGDLVCGTMSNLFVVKDQRVLTPVLDRCGVRGIMRGLLLELAPEAGITITESRLRWQEIVTADEVFISNSQFGIWPVTACDTRILALGPVTQRLAEVLAAHGVEECAG